MLLRKEKDYQLECHITLAQNAPKSHFRCRNTSHETFGLVESSNGAPGSAFMWRIQSLCAAPLWSTRKILLKFRGGARGGRAGSVPSGARGSSGGRCASCWGRTASDWHTADMSPGDREPEGERGMDQWQHQNKDCWATRADKRGWKTCSHWEQQSDKTRPRLQRLIWHLLETWAIT